MTELRKTDAIALGLEIESGKCDPRDLTEHFLSAAEEEDADCQVFARLTRERAMNEAAAAADRAKRGLRRSSLDGVPIAWKDNVDTAGIKTEAGSALLKGRTPTRDATVLQRATHAGLVCIGKTNMTELAYSGIGYNPIAGTPVNPHDAQIERLPGGSSAGSAVAVARGLAAASVGTDTGGSVRIPAAWNGLVGLKTTAGRLPLQGIVPLSPAFDTVGPITRTVADAAALDAIFSGEAATDLSSMPMSRLHVQAIDGEVLSSIDPDIRSRYEATVQKIRGAVSRLELAPLASLSSTAQTIGSPVAAEAFALWGQQIEAQPGVVFERIAERILPGKDMPAFAVEQVRADLEQLSAQFHQEIAAIDAVLMPTVAMVAPPIALVESSPDAYHTTNLRALSLTMLMNYLGLCAISLPLPKANEADLPAGLMVICGANQDRKLLCIAASLEQALNETG